MSTSISLALLSALAFGGPCPAGVVETEQTIQAALEGWSDQDLARYTAARDEALASAECLAEPATRGLAIRLHVLVALDGYAQRDDGLALGALRAARSIEPDLDLALWLDGAPPNPLEVLAEEAQRLGGGPTEPASVEGASLIVDGAFATERPLARPALVQALELGGGVRWSALLQPGMPLPSSSETTAYSSASPPAQASTSPPAQAEPVALDIGGPAPDRARTSRALLFSGAGAAAASAGLWVGAGLQLSRFRDLEAIVDAGGSLDSGERAEAERLQGSANGLGYAAQGAAVAAAALGGAGLIVRF